MPYWSSVSPFPAWIPQSHNCVFCYPRQRKVLHNRWQGSGRQLVRRALGHFQNQKWLCAAAHQFPAVRTLLTRPCSSHLPRHTATSKACSTSCSASPPRRPWPTRSPSGPWRSSRPLPSSATSARLRCVPSKRWTRRRTGYTKRTSTRYRSPRSARRPSACSVAIQRAAPSTRSRGSACSI